MKQLIFVTVFVFVAFPCFSEEEIPPPPDDNMVVLKLLDAMAAGGSSASHRAARELKRYPKVAAPLLRERLEDPGLPNWLLAANTLDEIAPAEMSRFEAGLGKAKPDLTVRCNLWRLSKRKRPPIWGYHDPFPEDLDHAPPQVAAIAALGDASLPELVRSLDDPSFRKQAAYVIGTLKLKQAAPELTKCIVETHVTAYVWGSKMPGRSYSLAASALAAMGPHGQGILLDHLAKIRFTIAPRRTSPRPRNAADLIIRSLSHVGVKAEVKNVLIRLLDIEDPAVRPWALENIISMYPVADRSPKKYELPVAIGKVTSMLDENLEGSASPSKLASTAAEYLASCVDDPEACEACVAQFEKERFLDTFLNKWSDRYGSYDVRTFSHKGFKNIRDRLKNATIKLLKKKRSKWRGEYRLVRLLGDLCYSADPTERDPSVLPLFKDILLNGKSQNIRADAAAIVGETTRWDGTNEAFDILSEAITKEMGRSEMKKKDASGEALARMVYYIPRTFTKDPIPLLEKVVVAPIPLWPRKEAVARLASFAELSSVETIIRAAHTAKLTDEDTTVYFGIHLLPAAIAQVNNGDKDTARASLRAIALLAGYPERKSKYYRSWDRVVPDDKSAAIALLAAKHIGPGVVRLFSYTDRRSYRICHAIRVLKIRETIPLLIAKVAKKQSYVAETLSSFELEKEDYNRLFEMAKGGNQHALQAISGSTNKKAVELYDQYKSRPLLLAPCLLRIGDERGVDLCLEIARSDGRWDDKEKAIQMIGLCKKASAAQKLLNYVSSSDYARGFAFALYQIGKPAVPAMLRALADPSWPREGSSYADAYRASLAETLAKISDERSIPILKWMCSSPHHKESRAAFLALCEVGTEAAKKAIYDIAVTMGLPQSGLFGNLPKLFKDDPRAGELFLTIAERTKNNSDRNLAAAYAARLTQAADNVRDRLYAVWSENPNLRMRVACALVWLGDKRVPQEAFELAAGSRWDTDAIARLDRRRLTDYAEKLLRSENVYKRRRGMRILGKLGSIKHEPVFRKLLDSPDLSERSDAAKALAEMKARGIAKELLERLNKTLSYHTVVESLGINGTDESADILINWTKSPTLSSELTRDTYWWIPKALKQNGRPKAIEAYKRLLYQDLVGDDIPRSRTALVQLVEIDKRKLGDKLVEMASSPKAHLRCLSLYGLMKYFSYKGPYDPFESEENLAKMVKDLRIYMEGEK